MSAFAITCIVYINGVKFSPMSVSVGATDGAHLSFSVDVPAVPEWDALPERSHCAVFFSDPVSNAWRFMCEGEYIGYNKVKSSQGTRRRTLLFRGLHAMWDSIQLVSMVGSGFNGVQTQIVANSQLVSTGTALPSVTALQTSLGGFLLQLKDSRALLSAIIPALIDAMASQSPVDTFYHQARKLMQKLFIFDDVQITNLLNIQLLTMLIEGLDKDSTPGKTLSRIIGDLENVSLYHHVPLLCPPLINLSGAQAANNNSTIGAGDRIPEIVFVPHLNGVIPPACNVIFTDQIAEYNTTRNFLAEPTRVIAQVETGVVAGNVSVPAFIVASSVEHAILTNSIANNSSITFENDRTSDGDMAAGIVSTHDLLSTEEYYRGVIPHFVSLPLENFGVAVTTDTSKIMPGETRTGLPENAMMQYAQAAARTHFDNVRAGARSASLSCVFLPYVAVGFPCLVEDSTGPFWGIISAVTHTIPATGAPTTQLQISHIREAYSVSERLRSPPLPYWLNSKFSPASIEKDVYSILFGPNVSDVSSVSASGAGAGIGHAAMLPADSIGRAVQNLVNNASQTKDKTEFAAAQVNLDELAKLVMNIPSYSKDFSVLETSSQVTIAANVHTAPDPGMAALKYQYRSGVTLSQYAAMHALNGMPPASDPNAPSADFAFGKMEPEKLNTNLGNLPDKLFGAPQRMKLMKNPTPGVDTYGPYQLAPAPLSKFLSAGSGLISPIRENAALMIKAAIDVGITEG